MKYLRSLTREGLRFRFYDVVEYYERFANMYHETMRAAKADSSKFFPPGYFLRFGALLGSKCKLAGVEKDGEIYSMVFFFDSGGILQYYYSGRSFSHTNIPSGVLLFSELAAWASENGKSVINYGGGRTTAPGDPVLKFKQSISPVTVPWYIGKRIHNTALYEELRDDYIRTRGSEAWESRKHMLHFYRQ
jgi:hypothetical protein